MDGSSGRGNSSGQHALSHYKLGRTLGIGAFAKVKLAVHNLTGLKVAIKIVSSSEAEKVRREIDLMRQLCHPHVVRLFEVIDMPPNVYVVMEYMNSGELFEYLTENRLHEDEARHFFQQIISGLEYCHRHMVVHRDLKPENLLLDSKRNVKIADFGLGNTMRDGHFLKTTCGSPNYAAPELIRGQLYAGPEVDVWSCGVILYALLCSRLPFDDDSIPGLYAKIRSGVYPIPNNVSASARDMISKILVVDPMRRITIPEIRRHPWFKKKLPLYIAIPSPGVYNRTESVDVDVVKHMAGMGFDIAEVVKSLHNHQQNQATVTYSMLLHSRSPGHISHHNENLGTPESVDYPKTFLHSDSSSQSNWTLGFKSQAPACQLMVDVLRVFHSLNVKWKQIGLYNMKCLWLPSPFVSTTKIHIRSADAIKFEIQLYKTSGELYVVDLQLLSGPPFVFLQICASFRALVI